VLEIPNRLRDIDHHIPTGVVVPDWSLHPAVASVCIFKRGKIRETFRGRDAENVWDWRRPAYHAAPAIQYWLSSPGLRRLFDIVPCQTVMGNYFFIEG
jgi:hypothetical protein